MADIEVIGQAEDSSINGGNSVIDLTTIAGLQEDDLIVLIGCVPRDDTPGGALTEGYTEAVEIFGAGGTRVSLFVDYKFMGPTPDTQVVGIGDGNSLDGTAYIAMALRGVDPNTPLDVAPVTLVSAGQLDGPSIETFTNGALVLTCGMQPVTGLKTAAPSGYINFNTLNANDTNDVTLAVATKLVPIAGVEDPGPFSGGNSTTNFGMATIAFRPISAGAGGLAAPMKRRNPMHLLAA